MHTNSFADYFSPSGFFISRFDSITQPTLALGWG